MLQKNQWKIWTWRRKPSVWRMVWRWCGKGVKPSLSVCQSGDEARNPPTPLYYTNIHRTNWQRAILKILRFFWKTFTRQGWYNQPHQTNLPWTINCEQEPRANLVMTQEMLTPLHCTNHYTIRVEKCQIFYTDQYQQTRFYPEKIATFLALQTYKTELVGFLVMNKCG